MSDIKHIDILRVEPFLHKKKFKLHVAFLDAIMIHEIEKPVEFEVSIGNYGNKLDENLTPSSSTTPPANAVFDGCSYYFIPWGDIKPCMHIESNWEDISYRLEALNQIKKLKSFVNSCITTIRQKLDLMGANYRVDSTEMKELAANIIQMINSIKQKAM